METGVLPIPISPGNLVLTSPGNNLNDFAQINFNSKHALSTYTVSAWIKTADTDGGVIVKRGIEDTNDPNVFLSNYELRVGANGIAP